MPGSAVVSREFNGAAIKGVLHATESTGLSDVELRKSIVEFEELTRFAQAHQAAAVAEMARRASKAHTDDSAHPPVLELSKDNPYRFVADELAVELNLSKVAATNRLHFATKLQSFRHTAIAFEEGRIDLARAREIVDQLQLLNDETFIDSLETSAVAYAASHTRPQLAAWLRKRIMAADPRSAEKRRRRARDDRRVVHYPGDDGAGHLWAQLDAADAVAVWRMIDQVAAASQYTAAQDANALDGGHRSMDQRRADALVDLVLGRVSTPQLRPPTEVLVTVSANTLAGLDDEPAELAGYGPITAEHARDLAEGDSRWRRVLFDDASGRTLDVSTLAAEPRYRPSGALAKAVKVRDCFCRFPGCRRAALHEGIDLDHVTPWPLGETQANNLVALCRSHHYLKTHSTWSVALKPGAVMEWTTPSGRTFTTHPADRRGPPALTVSRGDPVPP